MWTLAMLVAIKLMVDRYMIVDLRMTFRLILVGKSILKNGHFYYPTVRDWIAMYLALFMEIVTFPNCDSRAGFMDWAGK